MASSVGDEICPSRLVAQTVLFVACEKRIPRDGGALRHLPRGDAGKGKIRAAPSQWGVLEGLQLRIMENHLAYHGDDNFVKYVGEAFGLKSPAETFGRKWKRPPG